MWGKRKRLIIGAILGSVIGISFGNNVHVGYTNHTNHTCGGGFKKNSMNFGNSELHEQRRHDNEG